MPKKIPEETVGTVVELLLQGVSTKDIAERFGISTTSVNNIRRKSEKEGVTFPSSSRPTTYPPGVKNRVIELLLEGKTPKEVSEMIGVNKNTIMSWRAVHKREHGVDFPTHWNREAHGTFGKKLLQGFKYTDAEIIELVTLNPGYGVERFARVLYPKPKSVARHRYRITMLLKDHESETGEDLYELLQDPSYLTTVSESEYKQITGARSAPRGQGRAVGGRKSKPSRQRPAGTQNRIILPPQQFNWGDLPNHEGREWKHFERVDS